MVSKIENLVYTTKKNQEIINTRFQQWPGLKQLECYESNQYSRTEETLMDMDSFHNKKS